MSSFTRTWTISFLAIFLIIIGAGTVWASQYLAWFKKELTTNQAVSTPFTVEAVADNLTVPWSIVFTHPNRFLVAERTGSIKAINTEKKPNTATLYQFLEVASNGEEGLMSLILDPDYVHNKILYAAVAYPTSSTNVVKIVSLVDRTTYLELGKTIIDGIPAATFHAGTALAFGPDGKLYISTGDATDRQLAQDLNSLAGKILRINPDGTIPTNNPFPGSPVYSYGHRNSQGLAWLKNNLYSSEHGPSIFDGAAGGDEINLIQPGKNYGWPLVSHGKILAGTEPALYVFTPAEAPASLLAYTGTAFPDYKDSLFFGALKGEGLVRATLDQNNPGKIITVEKLLHQEYGRIRAVTQGLDGFIYFSTSNRDGRGQPAATDDRIFRLRPN